MSVIHLEFEKPIVELDEKIDVLLTFKQSQDEPTGINLDEEIVRLRQKSLSLTKSIFTGLGLGKLCNLLVIPYAHIPLTILKRFLLTFRN